MASLNSCGKLDLNINIQQYKNEHMHIKDFNVKLFSSSILSTSGVKSYVSQDTEEPAPL